MKIGTVTRSIDSPVYGFDIKREGFSIYIQYIPEDSVKSVFVPDNNTETIGNEMSGHNEYEYILYSYYGPIESYEDLIAKSVALKYTIEDEMSLINKMIANESVDEYTEYRTYVGICKTTVKNKYIQLGLNKLDN